MQDEYNDPLWRQGISGAQMLFVAFGALVLMPLITGMDPNVALFTAGIGTLLFQLVTGRQVPVFLASSFAFIAPILAAKGEFGLPAVLGGIVASGLVYVLLSAVVRVKGAGFIDRLLPPVVIAPVIISIGLALSPVAVNMAMGKAGDGSAQLVPYETAMLISMSALITTVLVAAMGRGLLRLVPILAGIIVGCIVAAFCGVIDTSNIAAAPWLAIPAFVTPELHWGAILYIVPVALAPAIEHIGGVVAIGSVTGKNFIKKPGLHRTLAGDGIGVCFAGFIGGPPVTTYAEVTGAVMITRNFNPVTMTWAAVFAIILAFFGKFNALLTSIPMPVMGGIMLLLFGSIAAIGLKTLVESKVDLGLSRNIAIVAVTLTVGVGALEMKIGDFALAGVGLASVAAILLNLILPASAEEGAMESAKD